MSLLPEKILKELMADDFASLTRIMQIEGFLKCLCNAGYTKITPQEISQLFKDANMDLPQKNKKIRCGAFKAREYLDLIAVNDTTEVPVVCVKRMADNLYKISKV